MADYERRPAVIYSGGKPFPLDFTEVRMKIAGTVADVQHYSYVYSFQGDEEYRTFQSEDRRDLLSRDISRLNEVSTLLAFRTLYQNYEVEAKLLATHPPLSYRISQTGMLQIGLLSPTSKETVASAQYSTRHQLATIAMFYGGINLFILQDDHYHLHQYANLETLQRNEVENKYHGYKYVAEYHHGKHISFSISPGIGATLQIIFSRNSYGTAEVTIPTFIKSDFIHALRRPDDVSWIANGEPPGIKLVTTQE